MLQEDNIYIYIPIAPIADSQVAQTFCINTALPVETLEDGLHRLDG